MRVIVCGGRSFLDDDLVWATLRSYPITALAHGGATGADTAAGRWANSLGIECHRYAADWETHGRAAGPIRNRTMLRMFQPDAVIAFPGGRGTADMIRQARAAGVRVIEVPRHSADAARGEA